MLDLKIVAFKIWRVVIVPIFIFLQRAQIVKWLVTHMKMQFKVLLQFMVLIIVSWTIMSCGIQGMDHRTEHFVSNRRTLVSFVFVVRWALWRTVCVYLEDGNEMNNTISENVGICNREDACGAYSVIRPGAVSPAPGAEGKIDFTFDVISSWLRINMEGQWTRCYLHLWNDKWFH